MKFQTKEDIINYISEFCKVTGEQPDIWMTEEHALKVGGHVVRQKHTPPFAWIDGWKVRIRDSYNPDGNRYDAFIYNESLLNNAKSECVRGETDG